MAFHGEQPSPALLNDHPKVITYLVVPAYCFPTDNQGTCNSRGLDYQSVQLRNNYSVLLVKLALRKPSKAGTGSYTRDRRIIATALARLFFIERSLKSQCVRRGATCTRIYRTLSPPSFRRGILHARPLGAIKMRHAQSKERGIIFTPAIHR